MFRLLMVLSAAALLAQGPPDRPPFGPRGGPPGGRGDGIWLRNAYYGELETFDSCFGHQPGSGEYHHHVQPVCLRAQLQDNVEVVSTGRTGAIYREKPSGWKHSPILGWAFDGYPIYGPYGYSDPHNPTSAVRRVRTGFRLRTITTRDSLPDWALGYHNGVSKQLTDSQRGPAVNEHSPLGRYVEDYEHVEGLGDLDPFNGRFTATPEFPKGTYAYFVTLDEAGKPAFPYIFALEYYGNAGRGRAREVPADAQEYFHQGVGTTDPLLESWRVGQPVTMARAIVGWDPAAGPKTTWAAEPPRGIHTSPGLETPTAADVQRVRATPTTVYVNSNDLPSYVIGPWFMSTNGGVFVNLPNHQNYQMELPRTPQPATGTHTRTPMGPVGIWVNGVAAFNCVDGASYRNADHDDFGGGRVITSARHVSAASLEGGPVTPGSLVTATATFDAKLATSTARASREPWPDTLAGATVTIRDAAGATHQAQISYASPSQVDYRVPEKVAIGVANVIIAAGGVSVPGGLVIVPVYPGLYPLPKEEIAEGTVTLLLEGTGWRAAKEVTATIGGQPARAVSAGADRIKLTIPPSLSGKVDIIVTADGKPSNAVHAIMVSRRPSPSR